MCSIVSILYVSECPDELCDDEYSLKVFFEKLFQIIILYYVVTVSYAYLFIIFYQKIKDKTTIKHH